jgi:hypothetical protein
MTGDAARQALRQEAWSIAPPQQSSAGVDIAMLSHGVPADCASALVTGPKPSQMAKSQIATMRALRMQAVYQERNADPVGGSNRMDGHMDSMMAWMMGAGLLGAVLVIGLLATIVVLLVQLLRKAGDDKASPRGPKARAPE